MATYTVPLPATNISPLIKPEQTLGGFTQRYYVPYTVISTGGASSSSDTTNITLGTTPTNWIVTSALVDVPAAAFFGGSSGTMAVVVGTTTTTNAFVSSFAPTTSGCYFGLYGPNSVNLPGSSQGTSTLTLQMQVTTGVAGASPTSLTSGYMVVLLGLYDPSATS
jgi:hypothetical protein